jgi:hypothetical protein
LLVACQEKKQNNKYQTRKKWPHFLWWFFPPLASSLAVLSLLLGGKASNYCHVYLVVTPHTSLYHHDWNHCRLLMLVNWWIQLLMESVLSGLPAACCPPPKANNWLLHTAAPCCTLMQLLTKEDK